MARDPNDPNGGSTALPGHAIGIRLFDADDQPVLYVDDDPNGHRLTLEVRNLSERELALPAEEGPPGPDHHRFALRFRKGVLQTDAEEKVRLAAGALPAGWRASAATVEADGITVYFLPSRDAVLAPGESLALALAGAQAAVKGGARTTRVELLYRGLHYRHEPQTALDGTRLHLLNVVNHLGHRSAPLLLGWAGAHRVLNDGREQMLVLNVMNVHHAQTLGFSREREAPTRFLFFLDTEGDETGRLVGKASLGNVRLELRAGARWQKAAIEYDAGRAAWVLAADALHVDRLGPQERMEVEVHVKTKLPAGTAFLHVRYENLPGFWENQLLLPIEKAPLTYAGTRVGIGTDRPRGVLEVRGLSDKPTGVGSAVLAVRDERTTASADVNYVVSLARQDSDTEALYLGNDGSNGAVIAANNAPLRLGRDFSGTFTEVARVGEAFLDVHGKVRENGHDLVPRGAILMWHGKDVPAGWALCDGTLGTPDLRQRFVVGAGERPGGGAAYAVGATGGASEVTLNGDQLPAHSHGVQLTTSPAGRHDHGLDASRVGTSTMHAGMFATFEQVSSLQQRDRSSVQEDHQHTVAGDTRPTGKGAAHENRPPYFALAFIMKL